MNTRKNSGASGRGKRILMRGFLMAVGAVVVFGFMLSGCSRVSTEPDEVVLHYAGGTFEAKKFERCINPSSGATLLGPGDTAYSYPYGQRTFDFSGSKDAESDPISVVSKDNVEMKVAGSATFTLNTDCKVLRQFHEKIGLKYNAYYEGETSEGWDRMLNFYFKQPLDRAMDAASQEFEWKKLYNDPAAKQQWEERVGELARQFIKETSGGDYFCNPNYAGTGPCGDVVLTIQKPEPPESLVNALAAEQAAKAENAAQAQRNAKIRTELESIRDLAKVLGPQGALLWQAIQSGKVEVIPVPQDGSITIAPQGRNRNSRE
ncbi:SPFH domain-containing protein [Thermostaphylospora chromogena]|uniref:SPFH domain / Band 7 family protein n=1 Tax=Thermostaphylospora chromogena TaxID=35622 RepID=A0A1H1FMA2_9ACTN|nr:SPFH domain-containing protein [Thermostaphylospora chromogena]SDR02047.1 SPFH domain / Band 7 family protein [Thermostaphylospora chromogena]